MSRSDHLTIGSFGPGASGQRSTSPTSSTSPADPSLRSPFGLAGAGRSGAGSPSEMATPGSGRLFPNKRAREIQAQEGISGLQSSLWGAPPTSGNSTPLRENIPESPTDGFPDFVQLPTPESLPQTRRTRAGTLPSRFSPSGAGNNGLLNHPALAAKTSRPTPSQSPFNAATPALEPLDNTANSSALLSRLRAGSMPQRSPFAHIPGTASPFGTGIFSSWNPVGRDRTATLASIASIGSNGPSSPAQSAFSREGQGDNDVHMRTLDYLGLAETPQPPRATLATPFIPSIAEFAKASRFRSYSVNNKDKYADDEEDEFAPEDLAIQTQYAAHLQEQLNITHTAIHNHNLAVQAFANQAAISRPRARTAGVLEAPPTRMLRSYYPTPSRLDNSITAADIHLPDQKELDDLPQAVAAMTLGRSNSHNNGLLSADEQGAEGPTSALWLGSIPTSTTTSTLTEMFKSYGPISSVRVLTHKNCGFVNYERIESAIAAKSGMNGREIFPGAGPIRINFAKPASASNTPGHDGAFPSPSPDPFAKGHEASGHSTAPTAGAASDSLLTPQSANSAPVPAPLSELTADMLSIVKQFGASDEETFQISSSIQKSIQFTTFHDEIPPVKEPAHTRVHDAPKLRDIRKRIDNQTLSQAEIESIAIDMLPEIAELSSDYLGNTVVQKLFEHCSDEHRDAMLVEIAPHMAEIGVHKNGTWAAQKIIDVCKTPQQMNLIVEHLRPYTIPLFLDQYGNYVLQGCLKFGAPFNDFIFETMLSRMWDIAQGRYGARAMRACLESHHSTKNQQRMLAAAIALHSVQLATNANGALLLTWFLDTCTFPQRRTVLSPQLVPYLVHLCTHKVAYLTVLKVINQKAEADARDTILKALFFTQNDQVLEAILRDHACGATLIFKVLTTPFFDESIRTQVVENVKSVLIRIKAQPGQGYKRLMDEVGLSTRNGGGSVSRDHSAHNERPRPGSRQASMTHQPKQQPHQQQAPSQQAPQPAAGQGAQYGNAGNQGTNQFYNPLNNTNSMPNYEVGYDISRSGSVEPPMTQQFPPFPGANPLFPVGAQQMPSMNLAQLQYQQNMLAGRGVPGMYPPPMNAGFGGFNNGQSPAGEQFRNPAMPNGSPLQVPSTQVPGMAAGQAQFVPPGFGMPMGAGFGGYNGAGGMQNMGGYMPEPANAPRRGRAGGNPRRDASPRFH